MRPEPGQVLHFSEDPTITRFVPHVVAGAPRPEAYVWGGGCRPGAGLLVPSRLVHGRMAWVTPETTEADRARILGPGGGARVHAVEYGWLGAIQTVKLFAYRLPAAPFEPFDSPVPHAHVATRPVEPLGPAEPVGDLLRLHEEAGIQLRVLPGLWSFWDTVITSSLGFGGIRLRNTQSHDMNSRRRPARGPGDGGCRRGPLGRSPLLTHRLP